LRRKALFSSISIVIVLGGPPSTAQNAYNTVSVIVTATNTVVAMPILVGKSPALLATCMRWVDSH
jgi:hypothetical protein